MKKATMIKVGLIGIGTLSLAKKKADKVIDKIVKKGLIKKKEGDGLVRKVIVEVDKGRRKIESIVAAEIKKATPVITKATGKASREGKKVVLRAKVRARKAAKKAIKKVSKSLK